jgi:hypothetical protein
MHLVFTCEALLMIVFQICFFTLSSFSVSCLSDPALGDGETPLSGLEEDPPPDDPAPLAVALDLMPTGPSIDIGDADL